MNPRSIGLRILSALGLMVLATLCICARAQSRTFVTPPQNKCDSPYDLFYQNEPGVYAFWALCEKEPAEIGFDYLGAWPLSNGFTKGTGIHGAMAGPVADHETAAQTLDARSKLEQQGIFLNKHAGTLAFWLNTGATEFPVATESLAAIDGKSAVRVEALAKPTQRGVCFRGSLTASSGDLFHAEACGLQSDTWYRVALTWSETTLSLYVNGSLRASTPYTGALDDVIYYYQLFPGCCETDKQMSMAKALISNRAWSAWIVAADFKPQITPPPAGGVLVTNEKLGMIHRAVLGYVDSDEDFSPGRIPALLDGLKRAGVASLRYTGGGFPDGGDWQGSGISCTSQRGKTEPVRTGPTSDTLQQYMATIAKPLHLDVTYTVNYASDPPVCDAGGDPVRNGADLVRFANTDHGYGIKRWEIGNEQYAFGGPPNFDLHPNPYFSSNGKELSTYSTYEPAFYKAMKDVDPSIMIAVPSAGHHPGLNALLHYQVPLLKQAAFDALVFHSYPITDPITDGTTLYPERIAAGTQVRGSLLSVQTQLLGAGKSPNAMWITEWNEEVEGNKWSKQTLGAATPLFVAMQLAEFMQVGAEFASWQAQGGNPVCSTYNYDSAGESAYNWWDLCGDTALVYTGPRENIGEKNIGLRAGDLTPAGRGFQVLSHSGFVSEGESMVRVSSDHVGAPWLAAYAATHRDSFAVLLINRDRESSHTVPVRFVRTPVASRTEIWSYGRQQYDQSREGNWGVEPTVSHPILSSDDIEVILPPFSINVVLFQ